MLKGLLPSIRKWFDIMESKIEEEELRTSGTVTYKKVTGFEVRETTVEEAKEKILEYYKNKKHEGESIYPDDVADELGLDLKVAMQAAEELIEEGKLEECYNCLSTDSYWGAF